MSTKPEQIEQRLRNLKNLSDLRTFFQELGYFYIDQPISTRGFKQELLERIDGDSLKLIAEYENYPTLYCEVKIVGRSSIERQLIKIERLLIRALPSQFDTCLLVIYEPKSKLWHFVNSKPVGNKLRLRRFAVGEHEKLRTAAERLSLIKVDPGDDWAKLLNKHEEAFDREKVSDAFFAEYRKIFRQRKKEFAKQIKDEHAAHNFLQQFLNRLMFIYFVQRKGWLGSDGNTEFIKHMWVTYKNGKFPKDTFYERWLEPLFFSALNNKKGYRNKGLPPEIEKAFDNAPFLNGGLFKPHGDIDDLNIKVADEVFEEIFEKLLDRYNFTVTEDTPFDQNVSVDPEMLGVVYEQLVNVTDTEDEQASSGIFYTPRIEVDFMCRRSLLEYLAKHAEIEKEPLYRLLFGDEDEARQSIDKDGLQPFRKVLRNVTVVDPACGSGAFLVGIMQVILDVERRLAEIDGKVIDEFNEKKRIIERSLYGVDVKDWAIGVAQLRLWLSLIVDADEKKLDLEGMKIAGEALLPSLAFKIREGDSLVQEIAGKPLPIRGHSNELGQSIKTKITELKNLKTDFFFNRGDISERELRRKEKAIYTAILDKDIQDLQAEHSRKRKPREKIEQQSMFKSPKGEQVSMSLIKQEEERIARRLEEIEERIKGLKAQRADISNAKHLFWGIEYAEIFTEDNGFDIVIGNPPYVRQEKIADPRQDNPDVNQRKEYKGKLQTAIRLDWPEPPVNVSGKADLYVYFYLRGLALLNPKGTFCFITSNSWLDVGYGKELQEFLVTRSPIYAIYDNQAKRSFKHADINTVIVLFGAPEKNHKALDHTARFVMFKKPFEEAIRVENLLQAEAAPQVQSCDDLRIFPLQQKKLWEEGLELDGDDGENVKLQSEWSAPYMGNKWGGKYLRAPDIYWKILEKGKGKLVRLGDIAEVRRGITTGANEFFYLDDKKIEEWGIEQQFLKPVIISPRECKSVVVDPKTLKNFAFVCDRSKPELKGTAAFEYIKWGEKQGFNRRPSCSGRANWYSLPVRNWAKVLWPMIHNDRQNVFWNPHEIFVDHNLFEIFGFDDDLLWGSLSWTGQILFRELHGRANLGQGALKTEGIDIRTLLIFTVDDKTIFDSIRVARNSLSKRNIGTVAQESQVSDHKALDDIFFNLLCFTSAERAAVYEQAINLVQNRLNKAESI